MENYPAYDAGDNDQFSINNANDSYDDNEYDNRIVAIMIIVMW